MSGYTPPQASGRIEWVDTGKGLAIILVVIGHVIRGLVNAQIITESTFEQFTDNWIYAFHMPLFFFLSGLFLPRSARKNYLTYVDDKLRSIAYPYFVWSVITVLFKSALSRFTNHPAKLSDGWRILFEPIEQFWFLYVLFILMIVAGGLLKLGLKPWMLVILGLILHPGLVPIPLGPWGPLAQSRFYAIYLAIGIWCGISPRVARLSEMNPLILSGVAASAFGILSVLVALHLQSVPAIGLLMAMIGSVGCLATAITLSQRPGLIDFLLRTCGLLSLEIFVAHTMASAGIRIALQKLLHIQDPATHLLLGTLAGLVFPIALGLACKRLGLDFVFSLRQSSRPVAVPIN